MTTRDKKRILQNIAIKILKENILGMKVSGKGTISGTKKKKTHPGKFSLFAYTPEVSNVILSARTKSLNYHYARPAMIQYLNMVGTAFPDSKFFIRDISSKHGEAAQWCYQVSVPGT